MASNSSFEFEAIKIHVSLNESFVTEFLSLVSTRSVKITGLL